MADPSIITKPEVAGSLYEKILAEQARRTEVKPENVLRYREDPLGFVMWAWRWGLPGPLEKFKGPDVWQKEFLIELGEQVKQRAFNGSDAVAPIRMTISSGHGTGKLACKSLVINIPTGTARWGDLKVGDSVFGSSGKPTTIVSTHEQGVVPIYRVTFDDGSSTLCGLEHLWNVRGRRERRRNLPGWRTITTEEILEIGVKRPNGVSQARQWEIPIQGSAQFEEREIDLHPYFVGIWLGDGTKGQPDYTKPFPELVDRLRTFGMEVTEHQDGKNKRVLGVSQHFKSGVFLLGSHERYIPDDYKFNTVENRRELLRGLLDTDGEFQENGSIGYSSTSKQLVDDVVWLVRSLGGKAMIQDAIKKGWYPDAEGNRVECRDCWRVTIQLDWNPFTIKHRRAAWRPCTEARYMCRWIDSIEYSHDEDSMCITVEEKDGLYLANDFIVTHNSTIAAMFTTWLMSTWPYAQGTVTANTFTQLETKTWATIERWFKTSRTAKDFLISGNGIKHRLHGKSWMVTPQTCKEENSEAFAGQHAATSSSFYVIDEASAVPDKIWEVIEGGLSDGMSAVLAMGNPTRANGKFFRINFGDDRNRWNSRVIDSRESMIANKKLIQEHLEDYGEDSDFFRVRVKGLPPRSGDMQYIPSDSVYDAQKRTCEVLADEPLVAGVDLARGGGDNAVVWFRRGDDARSIAPIVWPGETVRDSTLLIAKLSDLAGQLHNGVKVHTFFLDGGGVGGPIIDRLHQMGHKNMIEVQFGGQCPDPRHFANMRSWMWSKMRDWLGKRGAIPPKDRKLETDLTNQGLTQGAGSNTDRLLLESKESMKKRGLDSPDRGDSLALTFSQDVRLPRIARRGQDFFSVEDQSAQGWMA